MIHKGIERLETAFGAWSEVDHTLQIEGPPFPAWVTMAAVHMVDSFDVDETCPETPYE